MSQHTITLTAENFEREVLQSKDPVLVDFWAEWCGPCHAVAPVVEELASEFAGRAKVGKVDVEAQAELARRFEIRAIPSLLFFRDGEVVDQVTGAVARKVLAGKLEKLLPVAG